MGYRKMVVGKTEYRYTIGTTVSKVQQKDSKSFKLYQNSLIGHALYGWFKNGVQQYMVTPLDIARAIEGKPVKTRRCSHGTVTTELTCNPYEAEIHQRTCLMINCRECVANVADDI